MKVAVIADTHGRYEHILPYLDPKEISYIIHLGDFVEDGKALHELSTIPLIIVKGNNDYLAYTEPEEICMELKDKQLYICHGHRVSVYRGLDSLITRGKEHGADIILFGHTHRHYEDTIDDILILNPGSAAYARGGDAESIAILDLDTLKVQKIEF